MESRPGISLEELVERHGPLPPERAVHVVRQLCDALHGAHARGTGHGQVRPDRILTAEHGEIHDPVCLLDPSPHGDDRIRLDNSAAAADPGLLPIYMAPEQVAAYGEPEPCCDVYALGALTYFLVTGQPPFSGKTAIEVVATQLRGSIAPPSTLNPGVPADLEEVIVRCLRRSAEERYRDADRLEWALANCQCVGKWTDRTAAAWWQAHAPRDDPKH